MGGMTEVSGILSPEVAPDMAGARGFLNDASLAAIVARQRSIPGDAP